MLDAPQPAWEAQRPTGIELWRICVAERLSACVYSYERPVGCALRYISPGFLFWQFDPVWTKAFRFSILFGHAPRLFSKHDMRTEQNTITLLYVVCFRKARVPQKGESIVKGTALLCSACGSCCSAAVLMCVINSACCFPYIFSQLCVCFPPLPPKKKSVLGGCVPYVD